jgi:hypothetical protein
MTATQIQTEIDKLSIWERLSIIRTTMKSIKQTKSEQLPMEEAAKLMLDDYLNDEELTAMLALDAEDFYEYETSRNLVNQP